MQQKAADVGTVDVRNVTPTEIEMLKKEILSLASYYWQIMISVVKESYVRDMSDRHLTLRCSSIYASKLFRV